MKKRFFYEFSGIVLLQANDKTEAEKLVVAGISLENYLMEEELYEIDENYVANDKKNGKIN